MSSAAPRLELRQVSRRFGTKAAVKDVSLCVEAGQISCLLGPSGCGKSTTLRMVAGIETPQSGEILLDGRPMIGVPPEARGIGLMFQDFALFPHLKVAENVGYGLKRRDRDRVEGLLEKVGLAGFGNRYPHELSGGEQQRVALARAIAPKPAVMLMDEPFSGLDERLRDEVRDDTLSVLREEGTAVLLVTHDPQEAMGMADEIVLMRGGRVVQAGAPYTMYNNPVDLSAARFFSDINVIRGVVEDALVETAFGPFLAPGQPDGTKVDIAIRPQHLGIDFYRAQSAPLSSDVAGQAIAGEVTRARFSGHLSVIDFEVNGGLSLRGTVPGVFLPQPGRVFNLTMPRKHCRIFPAA